MTEAETAVREALAKMTPGEWIAAPFSSTVGAPIVASPSGRSIAKVTYFDLGPEFANHDAESAANAAGIVALRNHTPALLAKLDAARAEVARLREALERIEAETTGVVRELDNYGMCIDAVNFAARAALEAGHDPR